MTLPRHQPLLFRQQHDAFLFVLVGPGVDGGVGAGVNGQVWHFGGDIDQVAGAGLHPVLKAVAPENNRPAFDLGDGAFVGGVLVGLRAAGGEPGAQPVERPDGAAPCGADGCSSDGGIRIFRRVFRRRGHLPGRNPGGDAGWQAKLQAEGAE